MSCNDIQSQLTAWLLGDLDAATTAEVKSHLERCDGCRAAAREIEPTLDLLRRALAAPSGAPERLSAARRQRVLQYAQPAAAARGGAARRTLHWIAQPHPHLAWAAGIVVVVGIFAAMFLPASAPSRQRAMMVKATRSQQAQREIEKDLRELDKVVQPPSHDPEVVTFGILSDAADDGIKSQTEVYSRNALAGAASRPTPASWVAGDHGKVARGDKIDDYFETPAKSIAAPPPTENEKDPRDEEQDGRYKTESKMVGDRGALRRYLSGRLAGETLREEIDGRNVTPPADKTRAVLHEGWGDENGRKALAPDAPKPASPALNGATENRESGVVSARRDYDDDTAKRSGRTTDAYSGGRGRGPASGETVANRDQEVAAAESPTRSEPHPITAGVSPGPQKTDSPPGREGAVPPAPILGDIPIIGRLLERTDIKAKLGPGADLQGIGDKREIAQRNKVLEDDKKKEQLHRARNGAAVERPTVAAAASGLTTNTVATDRSDFRPEEDKTGPRFKAAGVNPFVVAAVQPFSTFAIDVDTAAYTLARNYLTRGYLPPAEAVRTEEFVNFFDYQYPAPDAEVFRVYADAAPSKFGHGLQLLRIGVKGRRIGREQQRRAVLTFLIDTSGSMNQPDRLGLIKKSLRLLVEQLAPRDLVAIVQYDSHARLVLEHTPAAKKDVILAALDALQCGGSTNLEEGMRRAYEVAAAAFVSKAENRVLLLSDGVANLGTVAAADILAQVAQFRKQGVTCSVLGFGIGTYNDEMLEALANKGDGAYAFVDSEAEARRVFVDDLAATLNTIAADVKIQVEFNPARVARYRQFGYENRQLRKEDFRNDAVDAGEVGSGQSVTALYELEMVAAAADRDRPETVFATVRVRYRRTDTGAVEEIERAVTARDFAPRFEAADARFRLAACAAEFAELLRGSPFAADGDYAALAAALRPAVLELKLDGRVRELLRFTETAPGMSRGDFQ